jgi:hypothetical protein
MKIDSLKLQIEFDFDNLICTVTDTERNISDGYRCYEPFGDYAQTIDGIKDFNKFIGDSVHSFLDDNFYDVIDDEYYEYYTNKIDGYFHGTGDLFSSAVVGCLLNGIDVAKTLQIATIFTYLSIEQTHKDNLDKKYGVEFELFLEHYAKNINESK